MSTMTVARLHKELGKLVERGLGRRRVCVNKPSFVSNLEGDGLTYHDVRHAAREKRDAAFIAALNNREPR